MKKVIIDPKKVIKVEPKMIKENFSNLNKLLRKKSAAKSTLQLPEYDELSISDLNYIMNYTEGLLKHINNIQ